MREDASRNFPPISLSTGAALKQTVEAAPPNAVIIVMEIGREKEPRNSRVLDFWH